MEIFNKDFDDVIYKSDVQAPWDVRLHVSTWQGRLTQLLGRHAVIIGRNIHLSKAGEGLSRSAKRQLWKKVAVIIRHQERGSYRYYVSAKKAF